MKLAQYEAAHFLWSAEGSVATIILNRPERKNPPPQLRPKATDRKRKAPLQSFPATVALVGLGLRI